MSNSAHNWAQKWNCNNGNHTTTKKARSDCIWPSWIGLHTINHTHQGCQHWMRVRSEKCEGRPLPAYTVAQVPKKLMCGGGGGGGGGRLRHFFSDLKILPRFCRLHSRGTLRTSQTSDKQQQQKKKILFWGREIAYQRESVRMWWNAWDSRSMRESWQLCTHDSCINHAIVMFG